MYPELKMRWPEGKRKALTFSYDDGVTQDIRLIKIFRKYNMKGTFNINTGYMGTSTFLVREGVRVESTKIPSEEIRDTYEGFELAVHGVKHPNLRRLPDWEVMEQVLRDREILEGLAGYVVRGMAYPGGSVDERVKDVLKGCGLAYARGVDHETANFALPGDPLEWACSCHHWFLEPLLDRFLAEEPERAQLLSVWGHAYEFDVRGDWARFEGQMERLSCQADIWYCSNIEMFDYCEAFRRMRRSADGSLAWNPSSQDLYFSLENQTLRLRPGETLRLTADTRL